VENKLFLAVANFGDRQSSRFQSQSTIWVLHKNKNVNNQCRLNAQDVKSQHDSQQNRQPQSQCEENSGYFDLHHSFETFGATEIEYFRIAAKSRPPSSVQQLFHFLAVSEEGDLRLGSKSSFDSKIYRLDPHNSFNLTSF
jgi:hypothetical protein